MKIIQKLLPLEKEGNIHECSCSTLFSLLKINTF